MSDWKHNLTLSVDSDSPSKLPTLDCVCIKNPKAYRSLALETCFIGRVTNSYEIDNKWYCSVCLYLRPHQIIEKYDIGSDELNICKEVVKDFRSSFHCFEVGDIFSTCEILTGDFSRSVESILQDYTGSKPCFVLRYQLVKSETGSFAIEPLYIPRMQKMVCDKSEVLSVKGLNAKSKEGIISGMTGMKSPSRHTQSKLHIESNHDESKENVHLVSSPNKPESSQNLVSSEEISGSVSKHGKPSRSSVRRSLVPDLDFSPVKQSRLDDKVKVRTECITNSAKVEMDEDSDSTWKDSWVSELLDVNDPIVENGGLCLTPIRLSLKRIRLDTTPSKEHFKSNPYSKPSRSTQKTRRTASSAESNVESDSAASHSASSSSILSATQPSRRSTRKSKCTISLKEFGSDSEIEDILQSNSRSARKRGKEEKVEETYSPGNCRTPRTKAISSNESHLDGERKTRQSSAKKKEPTLACTTPTSKRTPRFQLRSPSSNDTHSQDKRGDVLSPLESRTPLSLRKSGRALQQKSQSNEDTDDPMMSSVESRTPIKNSRVAEKTPKTTPKASSKMPLKSPRTPKTRIAPRTPSRSALTPSMPARATAPLTPMSSLEQVRKNLHVSAVPMSLPCRESEYRNIYNFLENKIRDAAGGCMYISGVPGTGKTATVHAVIRSLKEQVVMKKLKDFQYIETNGLRMTEPRQVFVQVLKGLTGQKCTPQQAQDILAERFCSGSAKNKIVVLLVDEVDMLRNRRQDVIYNLFDWPSKPNSHFIVLTIANTMDLPERLLKGRVTSRLGLTRLTFQPYSYKQLQEIVMSRLQGSNSFNDDAVELVARKVAACSGDVRRALDICRRASEVVEEGSPVTMPIINKVLSQMMNSANVCSIKACSRLEKLFLQAVVAENERTGVEETTFISVYRQFQSLCALSSVFLINVSEAMAVLNRLGTSGLLLTEHSRADIHQSIFLNVNADDIHYALNQAAPVS